MVCSPMQEPEQKKDVLRFQYIVRLIDVREAPLSRGPAAKSSIALSREAYPTIIANHA